MFHSYSYFNENLRTALRLCLENQNIIDRYGDTYLWLEVVCSRYTCLAVYSNVIIEFMNYEMLITAAHNLFDVRTITTKLNLIIT